ncbi:MAG: exodeoxyribonuclease VII small subunit [Acidobacteria bacterium]|nr:exodeoxyribonuclease VII small subunit [Acidobacteriota bacterium]MYC81493.1 exodeoxyribonuclease VII small subunit [Acidobacteriota bacterium]
MTQTHYKDFESAMKRLEEIVKILERGELPLASLLEMYEEGVKLQNFCQEKLDEAERKVEILVRKSEGALEREPFSGDTQQ